MFEVFVYIITVIAIYIIVFKVIFKKRPILNGETSINLGNYTDKNVLVGKYNGEYAKRKSNINSLINKFDTVIVIVPEHIMSINPSFLEVFIFDVYKKLGKEEFERRIRFKCEGIYKIDRDLVDVKSRIRRIEKIK